jgi:hypothetical protein
MEKETMCEVIVNTRDKWLSVQAKRTLIIQELKKKGVAFGDIEKYLLKQFRQEGYYASEADLKVAKETDKAWYHALQLFLGWVDRNYVSYDKKKNTQPKTRAESVKIRQKREKEQEKNPKTVKITKGAIKKKLVNDDNVNIALQAILENGYVDLVVEKLKGMGYNVTK